MSQSADLRESLVEVEAKIDQAKKWEARELTGEIRASSRDVIANMEAGREAHLRLIVQAEAEERQPITRPRLNQEIGLIRSCLRWPEQGNDKRAEVRLRELIDWLSRDRQLELARTLDLLTVVRYQLEHGTGATAIRLLEEVQFSIG
jgi:hypothetical protein